jgi:hypothetical protein
LSLLPQEMRLSTYEHLRTAAAEDEEYFFIGKERAELNLLLRKSCLDFGVHFKLSQPRKIHWRRVKNSQERQAA